MPRKRVKRPPAEPIPALCRPFATPLRHEVDGPDSWGVACSRCGQHLIAVFPCVVSSGHRGAVWGWQERTAYDPEGGPRRRVWTSIAGWRPDGGVWRPTREHLNRRGRARAAAAQREATPKDLDRLRFGVFHRSDIRHGVRKDGGGPGPADRLLPATFECPQCGAQNTVTNGSLGKPENEERARRRGGNGAG